MERHDNASQFPGYLFTDNPREKAVIETGLSDLSEDELEQVPEGRSRFQHLLNSTRYADVPGSWLDSTGRAHHQRKSEQTFLRIGPAELPLALEACKKVLRCGEDSEQIEAAGKIASVIAAELEIFRGSLKS